MQDNPSSHLSRLVSSLIEAKAVTIPVTVDGLESFYQNVFSSQPWSMIVHLGVNATERNRIAFELVAFNCTASLETAIDEEGPELLPSSFPLHEQRVHDWMCRNAGEVCWSRSAGTYFCNELYYTSLWKMRQQTPMTATQIIFIHVPMIERDSSDMSRVAQTIASFIALFEEGK